MRHRCNLLPCIRQLVASTTNMSQKRSGQQLTGRGAMKCALGGALCLCLRLPNACALLLSLMCSHLCGPKANPLARQITGQHLLPAYIALSLSSDARVIQATTIKHLLPAATQQVYIRTYKCPGCHMWWLLHQWPASLNSLALVQDVFTCERCERCACSNCSVLV